MFVLYCASIRRYRRRVTVKSGSVYPRSFMIVCRLVFHGLTVMLLLLFRKGSFTVADLGDDTPPRINFFLGKLTKIYGFPIPKKLRRDGELGESWIHPGLTKVFFYDSRFQGSEVVLDPILRLQLQIPWGTAIATALNRRRNRKAIYVGFPAKVALMTVATLDALISCFCWLVESAYWLRYGGDKYPGTSLWQFYAD